MGEAREECTDFGKRGMRTRLRVYKTVGACGGMDTNMRHRSMGTEEDGRESEKVGGTGKQVKVWV